MRANALIGMLLLCASAGAAEPNGDTVKWFQTTEQSLMDAVASGDKAVWERDLDDAFIMTSEEGEVLPREQLLKDMRPLPAGLSGKILVKELTVQEFPTFAVVRYLADETEQVFAQSLATKYRMTDTFRRDGKGWKMLASHASVVTAGAAGACGLLRRPRRRVQAPPGRLTSTTRARPGASWICGSSRR